MRRRFLLVVASLVCVAGSVGSILLGYREERESAALAVELSPIHDLGRLRQNVSLAHRFTLQNVSRQPITVLDVVTSCACAGYELSTKRIARGKSAALAINLNTGRARGAFRAGIAVVYQVEHEPERRVARLGLRAQIDPDCDVVPEELVFSPQEGTIQNVSISSRYVRDLEIKSVSCNRRFFEASILSRGGARGGRVQVTFKPEKYYRAAGIAQLSIVTNSANEPILGVPLQVVD